MTRPHFPDAFRPYAILPVFSRGSLHSFVLSHCPTCFSTLTALLTTSTGLNRGDAYGSVLCMDCPHDLSLLHLLVSLDTLICHVFKIMSVKFWCTRDILQAL
jgi:hypothetical protein